MQYLFTERAHLMCPHMCFGIVMAVSRPYDGARIRDTMELLSAAHPFLKALLGYEAETNAYYYRVTDRTTIELLLKDREIDAADSPEVMGEYRRLTAKNWDLFEEGMLKAAAWRMGKGTCFLFVFHHLLADGRGALELAEEIAACYAEGKKPVPAPERLIVSAKDLPDGSRLPWISRILVDRANRAWARERRFVSWQEYHAFANEFLEKDAVTHAVVRIGPEELDRIVQQCHDHDATVNDWLLAKMMLEENTEKIIMACDLRDRLTVYRKGALGNYSTAFGIEVKAKEKDPFALAEKIHARVRRKLERPSELYLVLQCYASLDPGIIDAAMISCRGGFPSKTGTFVGSMFFGFAKGDGCSVTNLGRIDNKDISEAFFIPPASPAIRKTRGVLTVNGTMTVCEAAR
ncbi:MAG: hypothetical protein IKP86_08120 [Anaerolineaceae bacterium]|nr:hypothetical protein [Anaerolineaceae bacterium]MBR6706037.1 hypothetical protein [Clostridia bacterium]